MLCQKVISGGQTGVDRGALDAALENNFPCGGWCPQGRQSQDGKIDKKYPLREIPNGSYEDRTRKNIEDSDGTLIIYEKELTGGTLLTYEIAKSLNKPVFLLRDPAKTKDIDVSEIKSWIVFNHIIIMNVAGPRSGEWIDGYKISKQITGLLIAD